MSKLFFCVTHASLTGTTGHHTITAHVEEELPTGEVIIGTPETHGIEYRALQLKFAGDITKWRESVVAEMLERHKARSAIQDEVMAWAGKRFELRNGG
jgi:hypothetical protein